jgi:hypothetical protein
MIDVNTELGNSHFTRIRTKIRMTAGCNSKIFFDFMDVNLDQRLAATWSNFVYYI